VLLQERDALKETLEAERRNNAVEKEGLQRAATASEQTAQQATTKVGAERNKELLHSPHPTCKQLSSGISCRAWSCAA
jgi:hypothetical protein